MRNQHRWILIICTTFGLAACGLNSPVSDSESSLGPQVSHGVAAGEVTSTSAVIWARADREARMLVSLQPEHGRGEATWVRAEDDFTGKWRVQDLQPDTLYAYTVQFTDERGQTGTAVRGGFRTAPGAAMPAPLTITWSGDFAGQNVCRDAGEGFPIVAAIDREGSDLFIGLGDMIYADDICGAVGRFGNAQVPGDFTRAADLPNFWAHWRYTRADEGLLKLLARTPYFAVWDDHEVVNDFGPLHDTRDTPPYTAGVNLLPLGLHAFLNYAPMLPGRESPNRLYRKVRWGKHAELFFLDNRQYRDSNLQPDSQDNRKTMLGHAQLAWLKQSLAASTATWKIIVSSVPIAIDTGFPAERGRDGWANDDRNPNLTIEGLPQNETGFEYELMDIMATLRDHNANAVFVTTDVHFASVFRFTPFPEQAEFHVHEVVVGPGNAGLFPNRNFDTSLGTERLFFFGPESVDAVTSWAEAKRWFNYGTIAIDPAGELTSQVKSTYGKTEFTLKLKPSVQNR